jgi:hypothetical protein
MGNGARPKRELYDQIEAMLVGIKNAKGET